MSSHPNSGGSSGGASASMSSEFFGLNLLLKLEEGKLTSKADVVIVLTHWFLVKNSNFRCIGIGDDRTVNPEDIGTELLPDGWNDSESKYTLRYLSNGELYILLGAISEDTLLINLLNSKTNKVSNIALSINSIVKSTTGKIQTMVPTASALISRLKAELVGPVFTGKSKDGTTQTKDKLNNPESGIHISPCMPRAGGSRNPDFFVPHNPISPLRDIGRGDLVPGGIGGGMIFDPFGPRPQNLPSPNPSGIRFDPFGPPGVRPNPDNDHFRPPGPRYFDDNMYM